MNNHEPNFTIIDNSNIKLINEIINGQIRLTENGLDKLLKDIAEIIKMDISTVSRIVKSKNVQTDYGIFPLRYFFS